MSTGFDACPFVVDFHRACRILHFCVKKQTYNPPKKTKQNNNNKKTNRKQQQKKTKNTNRKTTKQKTAIQKNLAAQFSMALIAPLDQTYIHVMMYMYVFPFKENWIVEDLEMQQRTSIPVLLDLLAILITNTCASLKYHFDDCCLSGTKNAF